MKKFLTYLFFTALFIGAVTIYHNYDMRQSDKIRNVLEKKYPSISFEEKINAKITEIYNVDPKVFRNSPHQVFLVFDYSFNRDITASFELTSKLTIDKVVSVGDLFVKEPNTYIFSILKIKGGDTLKYVFELRDDLGYPRDKKQKINKQ